MQSLRNTILIFILILMNSLATFGEDLIPVTGGLFGAKGTEQISNFQGIQSVTAEFGVLAATDTITAPTVIFAASGIPMYVGLVSASDHGKALIYDATSNQIYLQSITDVLDYSTVGSSLFFSDISDVSVEWAAEGWVPAWNASSSIWEATPAATTGSTGITESEVNALIESATTTLTPSEIGAASESALSDYLPLAGGTMAGDISMATHAISDVSQVNGLTSIIWIPSATDSMSSGEMRFWVGNSK